MNKHIVHIVPYFPPHIGGTENVAKEIAEHLHANRYSVEVITTNIGIKDSEKSSQALPVTYLKSIEVAHTPLSLQLLPKLLKLPSNSLIHLHIAQAFIPEMVALISWIRSIPYVTHIHLDVDPSGTFGFLLEPYKKIFLKRVLQNAQRVICLSKEQKLQIAVKYAIDEEKIAVVPNGANDIFFTKNKKKRGIARNILFVGRLSIQKNVPRLIEAMALVKYPVTLHIVGDGEERERIMNLIKEKNLKNIILYGSKKGLDLLAMYQNADLLVLPSNKEGFPLVILEAMATGLPIIASNIEGVRELVGNSGILVDPPSPQNFANEIERLLKDQSLLKKLSQKSRKQANKFRWKSIIKKVSIVYKECFI